MPVELTLAEWELILESLEHAKHRVAEYQFYPSYEFKTERLNEISNLRTKVLDIKKTLKGNK